MAVAMKTAKVTKIMVIHVSCPYCGSEDCEADDNGSFDIYEGNLTVTCVECGKASKVPRQPFHKGR